MSVDLTGVFLTTRPCLRHMRETGRGRIVIIASVAGKEGNPGACAYVAEKRSRIPMERFCTVEEIADMTAWAASPRCSFTTGQVFDVIGGRATC
ncbi:MAG: SDR family oxidoreductase [Alphaproteobacteria bacterium]